MRKSKHSSPFLCALLVFLASCGRTHGTVSTDPLSVSDDTVLSAEESPVVSQEAKDYAATRLSIAKANQMASFSSDTLYEIEGILEAKAAYSGYLVDSSTGAYIRIASVLNGLLWLKNSDGTYKEAMTSTTFDTSLKSGDKVTLKGILTLKNNVPFFNRCKVTDKASDPVVATVLDGDDTKASFYTITHEDGSLINEENPIYYGDKAHLELTEKAKSAFALKSVKIQHGFTDETLKILPDQAKSVDFKLTSHNRITLDGIYYDDTTALTVPEVSGTMKALGLSSGSASDGLYHIASCFIRSLSGKQVTVADAEEGGMTTILYDADSDYVPRLTVGDELDVIAKVRNYNGTAQLSDIAYLSVIGKGRIYVTGGTAEHGSYSFDQPCYHAKDMATITFYPDEGYQAGMLTINGKRVMVESNTYSFIIMDNPTITITFIDENLKLRLEDLDFTSFGTGKSQVISSIDRTGLTITFDGTGCIAEPAWYANTKGIRFYCGNRMTIDLKDTDNTLYGIQFRFSSDQSCPLEENKDGMWSTGTYDYTNWIWSKDETTGSSLTIHNTEATSHWNIRSMFILYQY